MLRGDIPYDAWALWEETFKMGDSVILITDCDKIIFGKIISWCDMWVEIRPVGRRGWMNEHIHWANIRFASHEGFPVRKVMDISSEKTIAHTRSKTRAAKLRELLHMEFDGTGHGTDLWHELKALSHSLAETSKRLKIPPEVKTKYVYFGDPFVIEGVHALVVNAGHSGEYYSDEPDEETVAMICPEGHRALLWDTPSVLEIGAA